MRIYFYATDLCIGQTSFVRGAVEISRKNSEAQLACKRTFSVDMALRCIGLIFLLLPAVFGAPTVHLQDAYYESATVAYTPDRNAVQFGRRFAEAQPVATEKPHIVEPTWITVTGPPPVYTPPGGPGQPPQVMQPYYTYVPVPPVNQPWPWTAHYSGMPSYYPGMPVLPPPAGPNNLCNQQASNPYHLP